MSPRNTILIWALLSSTMIAAPALAHPDIQTFVQSAFVETPNIVDCTLENGDAAQCYEFTVGYQPDALVIGPFCPATLDDVGGIWDWPGDSPDLYRIDRDFLTLLDSLGYRFFDDDGTVHVVDIATEQPSVDHACINVSADDTVQITMRLPVEPVMADDVTDLGVVAKVGVALDGVPIFGDAPPIAQTGHMPALDTCGGHVDPGGWYHWHATSTDIATVYEAEGIMADCAQTQDASAQFGYAFDGFAMMGSLEADGAVPTDLDACGGHIGILADGTEAYHYHASDTFPNLPACLVGVQAQANFSTTATAGIGAQRAGEDGRNEPPRPEGTGGMPPGFEEAAAMLNLTPEVLLEAMDAAGGPAADLAMVATQLGVTEDALRAALPAPRN